MTYTIAKLLHQLEQQRDREVSAALDDPDTFDDLVRCAGDELASDEGIDPGAHRAALDMMNAAARDLYEEDRLRLDHWRVGGNLLTSVAQMIKETASRLPIGEIWHGLVGGFVALPVTAEGRLSGSACPAQEYAGAEVAVEKILGDALDRDLRWASGKLRLMAARSSDGHIRAVQASVGRNSAIRGVGAHVVLTLRDDRGATAALTLTPDHPTAVASTALSGRLEDIELTVCLAGADPNE